MKLIKIFLFLNLATSISVKFNDVIIFISVVKKSDLIFLALLYIFSGSVQKKYEFLSRITYFGMFLHFSSDGFEIHVSYISFPIIHRVLFFTTKNDAITFLGLVNSG